MSKKEKHLEIIKTAVAAALMISSLFLVSSTCSQNPSLKCFSLCFSLPISTYKENDEVKNHNLTDTILIFYYSDLLVYRLLPTAKWETGENIKGTEPYFIYNKRDSFGILFNSITDSSYGANYRVDSLLFNRGFKGKDLDIPADSLWSLVEVKKDNEDVSIQKYALLKQGDETSIDSIYYYYSKKMKNIEYSFSKKLDSISGMKLFKTRLVFNSKFSRAQNFITPKREISFEIREEKPPNAKEILSLIKRYQRIMNLSSLFMQ